MRMSTIAPIKRKTTRVELNDAELNIIQSALFDGLVRLMKDSKSFDITNPDDDDFLMESKMEAHAIKVLQDKLKFALKQIELDGA